VARAQADVYDAWGEMHHARARAHEARGSGDGRLADQHDDEADAAQERALAAQERLEAARHQAAAAGLQREEGAAAQTAEQREQAAERERQGRQRDARIRRRLILQQERERHGWRRFLPGPSSDFYSPGMLGTASHWAPTSDQDLDTEIAAIARALDERGATSRDDLAGAVGARYWGPGRFRVALRAALEEGEARRLSHDTFAPPERTAVEPP
jgi:hypothetical protein